MKKRTKDQITDAADQAAFEITHFPTEGRERKRPCGCLGCHTNRGILTRVLTQYFGERRLMARASGKFTASQDAAHEIIRKYKIGDRHEAS